MKPLWKCPECGSLFVTRNMSHSCGAFTVDALFRKSDPALRKLFDQFSALVAVCGPMSFVPQKTRGVFMQRTRFAAVYPRRSYFWATFILGCAVRDPRIEKVEPFPSDIWLHWTRITSASDLDQTLQRWLRESYEFYGTQGRFTSK